MTNQPLIPFDLECAKAGDPVVTRDGRKARIVCFDMKGKQPIAALLLNKRGYETWSGYTESGRFWVGIKESESDLFMAQPPIPEGFIRHDGGACPVDPETVELVLVRDSEKTYVTHCHHTIWNTGAWKHFPSWGHIIAYKLKPTETAEHAIKDLAARALGMFLNPNFTRHDEKAEILAKHLTRAIKLSIAEANGGGR